jgi:glycosyltransferase involved in cell wall biosynthesis
MKQLYHFAQEVCRHGHQAQILIAGSADTVRCLDEPPLAEIVEMRFAGPQLAKAVRRRTQEFQPDIIHVWTPRHIPALAGWQLHLLTGARIIVDHEDDEEYHLRYMRNGWTMNWCKGVRRLAIPVIYGRNVAMCWLAPLDGAGIAHCGAKEALSYQLLMRAAVAHTAISPNLAASIKRESPTKPVHVLCPGANLEMFKPRPRDADLEAQLGLSHKTVLVYSGTMSLGIFVWFMEVLRLIINQRDDIRLILIGEDGFRSAAERVAQTIGTESFYHLIGQAPYTEVPRYLSLADILIQHPIDQGNHLRFPAKLSEYLAMGKPVITFASGIGESLEDGIHVRKLYTDDASEAARVICELLDDPGVCESLGRFARTLAEDRFDWKKNGSQLVALYELALAPDNTPGVIE